MEFVLLGIGLGLVTILAPGPVSLSLLEVAMSRGRRAGLFGAVGIIGGDIVTASLALGIVLSGALLPGAVLGGLSLLSALIVAGFGIMLVTRPSTSQSIAGVIRQPGRTFFSLVTLAPTVIGGWVALFSAMPFGPSLSTLGFFALGMVTVSCIWYPTLATIASWLGPRLTPNRRLLLSRLGGLVTFGLGVSLLVG